MSDTLPAYWWRDRDLFARELAEHGDYAGILLAHADTDVTRDILSSWRLKHELPKQQTGIKPKSRKPVALQGDEAPDDSWLLDLLKRHGDSATVFDLANEADCSPRRVQEALERLGEAGFRVSWDEEIKLERAPTPTNEHYKPGPELFDGDLIRFGIVSDTHLGSMAERPADLSAAYEHLAREEIGFVLHAGDLVDGLGIYKGQVSELLLHTYEAHVAHAIDVYPRIDGITTYLISGNHDLEGEIGRIGADPVQAVCNQRDDMVWLGRYSADVDLPNGGNVHLLHPMGGASYALSYKPQKIVEGYELGAKPSCLIIGHWHRAGYFFTRGVQTLLAGTFQGPTTYSIRKAFGEPGFGFWIVEARMADDGSLVRFKPEWLPIYAGRKVAA